MSTKVTTTQFELGGVSGEIFWENPERDAWMKKKELSTHWIHSFHGSPCQEMQRSIMTTGTIKNIGKDFYFGHPELAGTYTGKSGYMIEFISTNNFARNMVFETHYIPRGPSQQVVPLRLIRLVEKTAMGDKVAGVVGAVLLSGAVCLMVGKQVSNFKKSYIDGNKTGKVEELPSKDEMSKDKTSASTVKEEQPAATSSTRKPHLFTMVHGLWSSFVSTSDNSDRAEETALKASDDEYEKPRPFASFHTKASFATAERTKTPSTATTPTITGKLFRELNSVVDSPDSQTGF